jgi:pimeloyl-ACP methyl ester carboxylesterase
MSLPETRYAKSGDFHIAYQVLGTGDLDLVVVPGAFTNLEVAWEIPWYADFNTQLAAFSRLICFDKRGTGLSDRISGVPTLEERMDDVRAVMDAVGSEHAALLGMSDGGAMSMLFSATYPERTRALVLYGTFARFRGWVSVDAQLEARFAQIERAWGTGESLRRYAPSLASDEASVRAWGRLERLSVSPSAIIALLRMNAEIDIRHVLPAIRVPTLVLHRSGDLGTSVEGAFWPRKSRAPNLSNYPASTICRWPATAAASSARSRSSSPARVARLKPIECWQRCYSPISSTRRSAQPNSATASGAPCSTATTLPYASRSGGFAAMK